MAMEDGDRRWWSTKKKGLGKTSSNAPMPYFDRDNLPLPTAALLRGDSNQFQCETNDAELTRKEELSKTKLGVQMAGSLEKHVEMLKDVVTSISFEKEQQLSKIRELEMKLEATLVERQMLWEEVEMLRPQQHVLPDLNSFEEGAPSLDMLQEALRAMQIALLMCAVKMGEQVKPYLGSLYSIHQSAFHRQLCDCFFRDFETSPLGSSQVEPHKSILFKEFIDYQTEEESTLFTMQHTRFQAFFTSRFNIFIYNQCYNTPFTSPEQRQSVLVKLLRNERSPLFADFARLAKKVWLLHKLAFALEPTAQIIRVNEGSHFDPESMEIWDGECAKSLSAEVAFMTSPGFTLRNLVVKAQVQLKKKKRLSSSPS